jgi:A/G-specific adenine glycosylase
MFSDKIIYWYEQNKRELPWRLTKNPYNIWLSEIILQQTRVNQGLPYYEVFVKKFPTIKEFAEANEDEILRTWQGLGYYSRARNMHFTSKIIKNEMHGKFPETFQKLKKLKGIGNYTAAAIASFAYNEPVPVIDGNVYRVLSRFFEIEKPINESNSYKVYFELAESLIDKKRPDLFNQAIMELGALICKPQNPNCQICPVSNSCLGFANKSFGNLPIKLKKLKVKTRYLNYLVFKHNGKLGFKKRKDNDIWQNMFDFPLLETNKEINDLYDLENLGLINNERISLIKQSEIFVHKLTHQRIEAKFFVFRVENKNLNKKYDFEFYDEKEIEKLAKPKLIVNFLASFFEK